MICYECSKSGHRTEAVGICHHCSIGLCATHTRLLDDPVTTVRPVATSVVLPKHARILLCEVCYAALQQKHTPTADPTAS
jgi:hypothetical protein